MRDRRLVIIAVGTLIGQACALLFLWFSLPNPPRNLAVILAGVGAPFALCTVVFVMARYLRRVDSQIEP